MPHQSQYTHNPHPVFRSICCQHECRYDTVEHIGTGVVADHFLTFCLDCRAEQIIGCRLSICSAGDKNLFRTCPESSIRIFGSILSAILPARVTPCLPASLHTTHVAFEIQIASILRKIMVFLQFDYSCVVSSFLISSSFFSSSIISSSIF